MAARKKTLAGQGTQNYLPPPPESDNISGGIRFTLTCVATVDLASIIYEWSFFCESFTSQANKHTLASLRRVTSIPDGDAFEKYCDTPPIYITMLLQKKYAFLMVGSDVYTTNLYVGTPPICTTMLVQKCQGRTTNSHSVGIDGLFKSVFRIKTPLSLFIGYGQNWEFSMHSQSTEGMTNLTTNPLNASGW